MGKDTKQDKKYGVEFEENQTCSDCLYTAGSRFYTDFNNTPVGTRQCILKDCRIKEPVSGYGVTVEWSKGQIQSAARAAGIENITYVDVQTISFLLGIYTRRKLIIYGD